MIYYGIFILFFTKYVSFEKSVENTCQNTVERQANDILKLSVIILNLVNSMFILNENIGRRLKLFIP